MHPVEGQLCSLFGLATNPCAPWALIAPAIAPLVPAIAPLATELVPLAPPTDPLDLKIAPLLVPLVLEIAPLVLEIAPLALEIAPLALIEPAGRIALAVPRSTAPVGHLWRLARTPKWADVPKQSNACETLCLDFWATCSGEDCSVPGWNCYEVTRKPHRTRIATTVARCNIH